MGMTPAIQSLGSKVAAQKRHVKAIARYYEKPNHCLRCGTVVHIRDGENISDTRVKKFCNRSCAGSYNNSRYPKRHKTNQCAVCEEFILAGKKFCSAKCRKKARKPKQERNLSQYVITWRQRTKLRAIEYKGGHCQVCGYDKSTRALTFHHLNPHHKDFNISAVSKAWKTIREELNKCVLLCANCHAEVHEGLLDLSNFLLKS